METIGVRELREHTGDYLRRVEKGETIEVTDRGRPVALLCPVPPMTPYERMVAAGDIVPATCHDDFPEPLELPPGVEPPSVTLAKLREHER